MLVQTVADVRTGKLMSISDSLRTKIIDAQRREMDTIFEGKMSNEVIQVEEGELTLFSDPTIGQKQRERLQRVLEAVIVGLQKELRGAYFRFLRTLEKPLETEFPLMNMVLEDYVQAMYANGLTRTPTSIVQLFSINPTAMKTLAIAVTRRTPIPGVWWRILERVSKRGKL